MDREAFSHGNTVVQGEVKTTPLLLAGKPAFRVESREGISIYRPDAVLGVAPLQQFLIPFPGGRWQTLDVSYDSNKREWFDATGNEQRSPHDWGYWKNRAMTWNVQCASCHMTSLKKGYDADTDSYKTTWQGQGISCTQCHGNLVEHEKHPYDSTKLPTLTREQSVENCGSCHARREELTGQFTVGKNFFDHFRPLLMDDPGAYYADGQILQEDFEYGSFLMSRMAHRGVTCLDCHNPHSGKTRFSLDGNELCLQCHTQPGRGGAIPIVPENHTFHAAGKSGSRCINCHMPETPYMQRHLRRDHGFTSPDPLLTVQLGIPNACNRCHGDKTPEWAADKTNQWYGVRMNRPARVRALVVARARKLDSTVVPELLLLARNEEIPARRASLLSLLAPWADDDRVDAFVSESLKCAHPLVRAAAASVLGESDRDVRGLAPFLSDPVQLVRLDATAALWGRATIPPQNETEYRQYLDVIGDQPAGALRKSELASLVGDTAEAERWARKAATWDPAPTTLIHLGTILQATGKSIEAEKAFSQATEQGVPNGDAFLTLGLFYAEQHKPADAKRALIRAVEIDPKLGRAWYNLGLLQARSGESKNALQSLTRAEEVQIGSPEPAYARATILAQLGQTAEAKVALIRALEFAPTFRPAQELLAVLSR